MNALFSFAKERVGSLVSKKVGAAVLAEGALVGSEYQGWALMLFIICQAAVDAAKAYAEAKYGE